MAIRTVITRGYGNGTFNGTIPLVALRGYTVSPITEFIDLTAKARDFSLNAQTRDFDLDAKSRDFDLTAKARD